MRRQCGAFDQEKAKHRPYDANGAGGQKSDRRALVRRQRGESETRMPPAAENFSEPACRVATLRSERGYLLAIYDVSSAEPQKPYDANSSKSTAPKKFVTFSATSHPLSQRAICVNV